MKICWDTGTRSRQRKKPQESHWCLVEGQRGTGESVAGRGEMFKRYSGKRKSKEKLRSKANKNEQEAQSSGSQTTALAPQKDLFGKASKGGRKDIFSLGSIKCKEERKQVGKRETWHGPTQEAEQKGSRSIHKELERQKQKRMDERDI